ncbi:MAG TPA: ABC transporter ATP-binding protein [Alphaproteobacteria bacterium]|nr:ABC transporter ATP-binding protein [Alphaproteobacteria bacterium]
MTALTVDIRRKIYRQPGARAEHVALDGVAFTVPEGQFACVVGPSGCGKTTMLNIIGGLDRAFDGKVGFGEDGGAVRPRSAYVFQTPRLMPWLSVLDNVRLVLKNGATSAQARDLLVQMGLESTLDSFPNRLSGGMQRRVALARAFAIEPTLLLLDEPFVSLDLPGADHLRGSLLDLWQQRPTTVLFVTHDLREALQLADRILFMSASPGRVVLDFRVDLSRPRRADEPGIEAIRRRLLAEHPDLLAGLPPSTSAAEALEGAEPTRE